MCKSRSAAMASQPRSRSDPKSPSSATTSSGGIRSDSDSRPRRRLPHSSTSSVSSSSKPSSSSSSSLSAISLASLRGALPELPTVYPFTELAAATNNFLAKRLTGTSSSAWRCTLRGRDAVVIQGSLRRARSDELPVRLAALGRSHHSSLVRIIGACPAGDHFYLVYEYVAGASLADCLRNPRNPGFTPLASWISRVQVAADVAQGLEYIHKHSSAGGGVHNRVESSAIIVTESDFRAKLSYFGAADLAGEIADSAAVESEITSISSTQANKGSRIEGTRGYMAPELLADGAISQQSDVYAFGVVLLELLSGDEPLKYRYDKERKEFEVVSLIETAREVVQAENEEERGARVRGWVDRRLRDSFPVDAALSLIRVALRCVEPRAAARPDMTWAAGKVSKVYLESKVWAERVRVPAEFSVSMAPR